MSGITKGGNYIVQSTMTDAEVCIQPEEHKYGPCTVCRAQTCWACSDCTIDKGTTVYVCNRFECRKEHELNCTKARTK